MDISVEKKKRVYEVEQGLYLVPFLSGFVDKYFEWMGDEELRKAVDTEEMTLEEVKEAQELAQDASSNCKQFY
jgi:hypothetical protein